MNLGPASVCRDQLAFSGVSDAPSLSCLMHDALARMARLILAFKRSHYRCRIAFTALSPASSHVRFVD